MFKSSYISHLVILFVGVLVGVACEIPKQDQKQPDPGDAINRAFDLTQDKQIDFYVAFCQKESAEYNVLKDDLRLIVRSLDLALKHDDHQWIGFFMACFAKKYFHYQAPLLGKSMDRISQRLFRLQRENENKWIAHFADEKKSRIQLKHQKNTSGPFLLLVGAEGNKKINIENVEGLFLYNDQAIFAMDLEDHSTLWFYPAIHEKVIADLEKNNTEKADIIYDPFDK